MKIKETCNMKEIDDILDRFILNKHIKKQLRDLIIKAINEGTSKTKTR
jgi:DNA-binding protein YbaB